MEAESNETKATLSIIATPIGNMEDITLRALRTLKEADVVFAEDTRVAAKLLARYEIRVPVHRLDAEVEIKVAQEIVERLSNGERVVYISDAGTPGISDPGVRLVQTIRQSCEDLREAGQMPPKIEAIPGPSALTAALSIAGVDISQFMFLGFLPHKKGRQTALKELAQCDITVVLYESPHRISKLLDELTEYAPEKRVTIARELTKIHEEVIQGFAGELKASLESRGAVRGEFVVIVESKSAQ